MSSILGGVASMLTPELVAKLTKWLGGNSELVQKGLKLVGPILLVALGRKAASPGGPGALSGLFGMLPSDAAENTDGLLDKLASSDLGSDLVGGLLGSQTGAVTRSLTRSSGIPGFGDLLQLVAPLGLAQISKTMKDQNLDANDFAAGLKAEADDLANSDDESAKLVLSAFKDVDAQDALKATIGEEGWAALSSAPTLAAGYVAAAGKVSFLGDPLGSLKEMEALAEAFDPDNVPAGSALLDGVVNSIQDTLAKTKTGEVLWDLRGVDLRDRAQVKTAVTDKLKLANEALAAVPADEQALYKQMIVDAATKVAEAGKEGGFLGIGGKKVSDDEGHALWNIKAALGL